MEYQEVLSESRVQSKAKNNLILQFDDCLDRKSHFFSFNESALENLIEQLANLVFFRDLSYWLTIARINELVLLCAGNYANNGEFSLMSDLLLNPRLTLIHIRGQNRPVVPRHTLLTDQFRQMAESKTDIIQWLKEETIVEIKVKALLPHLLQGLEHSGVIRKEYLESVKTRTKQIADWVEFLHGRGLMDNVSMYQWLSCASPADRKMFASHRLRFDLEPFWELGRQIKVLAGIPVREPILPWQHPLLNS